MRTMRHRSSRSRGFSLIELMLALALGLVITAGIVQLFVGNNQTYRVLQGQSRLQEGARYALDFISESARAAGYFGCDPDEDKRWHTLNAGANWANLFEIDIRQPVAGFEYTGGGGSDVNSWTPSAVILPRSGASTTTPIPANGIDMSTVAPETDILALRRVDIPGERIAAIVQPTTTPIALIDDGEHNFAEDDFAVIGNCEQATVFRITGVGNAFGNVTLDWDDGVGAGIALYQNATGATLSADGIPFGSATDPQGSAVSRITTDIYYIADGTGTNNFGQTPLSLWRKSGLAAPVELVEGVRDLQVWYGVDTTPANDNDTPNTYVTADAINATDVIRAIRVQIEASTVDVVTDNENDEPSTRTFSQTISLRNMG